MTAVVFDRVSIVFGDKPHLALPLMDQGDEQGRHSKPNRSDFGRA